MTHLRLLALNYLLNSLWQIPVIYLVALLAARLAKVAGPQLEHRIWVAALMLEAVLPACGFAPALRNLFLSLIHSRSGRVTTQTTILNVTAVNDNSHIAAIFASTALVAYAVTLLFVTARLLYRLHRTRSLRHTSQPVTLTAEPLKIWQCCTRIFSVQDAQLATSAAIIGPSTIGIRRRILLLPPTLLSSLSHEDLAAAIAHEFVHMRRRDFAKNLVYELIALPIAWHPFLWVTRLRIAESREMVCDEIAARATCGTTRYAHSLLRLAESFSRPTPPATLHAIGILDANILERRVMQLTHKRPIAATSRRIATAVAVLLGAVTCASAMSLRLEVPVSAILSARTAAPARAVIASGGKQAQVPIRISGGVIAGQIVSKVNPVYPVEAKEQGIQGAVILHAIIDKDGTVKELAVISGPPELQASAVEAVRQWVYKPYLLNGQPTEVDTTVTVNYSLDNAPQAPPPPTGNSNEETQKVGGPDGQTYNVGGSVRAPVLIYAAAPEYPQAARKAKLSGNVLVSLIVDPAGEPQNVHIAKGLGNELDEKAVEAVQQYRFKPATRDGEPVSANLKVEVNFQVF